jgi:hypothetical protein
MERTKLLLTVAPVVALVVAIAYLQGYWGYYKLLVFPYLSFNEILAYAAAPLFGFVLAYSVGLFIGVINEMDKKRQPTSKFQEIAEAMAFVIICALLIYFDRPEKWTFVPVIGVLGFTNHYLEKDWVRERVKASPNYFLATFISVSLVFGSFGWGRTEAQRLAQNKTPNVQVQVESEVMKVRLLGKISAHYFFLDQDGKVNQYPDSSIKRLTYEMTF